MSSSAGLAETEGKEEKREEKVKRYALEERKKRSRGKALLPACVCVCVFV